MSGRDFLIRPQQDIERALSTGAHGGNFIRLEELPVPGRPMNRLSQF